MSPENIKLLITIVTFAITCGTLIYKMAKQAAQIEVNTNDIEEMKKHSSDTDALLNQINISIAQVSVKIDILMGSQCATKKGENK